MKKFAVILVALSLSLVACQTGKSGSATNEGENSGAKSSVSAQDQNAPNQPKKPEYQAKAESMARTNAEWATETYNYGQVTTGEKVTHQFRFKNTGSEPLVLTRVKPSCGCTTPDWSREPVAPGEEGYIDVTFNTTGKKGLQNKTITVTGNFEGSINKILRISGEVLEAPAQ